ncbi:NADAR family protein [Pseudoflavitalea rhizosphaerae]|uniref:NADAR family protein n=1 Tax=Pseudoflavitalea rhizosphaerae TaxID=1884793 RepID=UPI0019CFCD29|nr:NADAR family protein [Pseudoflavitalea rhizosphaerae]
MITTNCNFQNRILIRMELKDLLQGHKHYNIDWLINETESGTQPKYINFWGHTSNSSVSVGKECFSQWYRSPFTVNRILYKTAEHWMMAQKANLFDDRRNFQKIIESDKPGEAKDLGRQIMGYDDEVWNEAKFDIVKLGNIHKFNQHQALLDFLLGTGNRVLVEASPLDKIWGAGIAKDSPLIDKPYAWPGINLLGFALMEVRDFFLEYGTVMDTNDLLPPPWIRFPEINPHDMFWRMGCGEEYILSLYTQNLTLDSQKRIAYFLNNPAPLEWKDYYSDF